MTPERPAYFEGQILAAADLTSAVDYGRGQVARHERYLHSWGIAEGLELTANKDVTGTFVNVTLGPGVAIDGTGREIIVPTLVTLSTQAFAAANPSAAKKTPYPILLHGLDSNAPAAALTTGACGAASQPTRTQEGFGLTYGAPGADLNLDQQKVPDESAGPSPDVTQHWEILVGHVQWDPSIGPSGQFSSADNTGRRYAGVMADTVAARGGTLTLQSQQTATPGQPALVIGGNPPVLTFGLYQGGTDVNSLLTVTAQGDVTAAGTIVGQKGVITQGEVRVQSGTVTDGLIIPLPSGISQDQVDNGNVTIHLLLTLHTPQAAAGTWYVPLDCSMDASHKLACQVLVGTSPTLAGTLQQQSGAADYLVVATVTGGGNL
jgi:hypothetical protein